MIVVKQVAHVTVLALLPLLAAGCAAFPQFGNSDTPPADTATEPACDIPALAPAVDPADLVLFCDAGKWGAKDPQGRIVIPAKFDRPFAFHEGLAGVCVGDLYGFIGPDGQWVIPARFDAARRHHFIGNVCAVAQDGRLAVIDKHGNFVWPPGLCRAENLAGGIYITTPTGRKGFLNNNGQLLPNDQPNPDYYQNTARCG